MLLGLDIGTSQIKAGLFALNGQTLGLTRMTNQAKQSQEGIYVYDSDEMWESVQSVISALLYQHSEIGKKVAAIGIASMAESGLLMDRRNGAPSTPIYAWHDRSAEKQVELLNSAGDPEASFIESGIRPTYKCSLARLLWLIEHDPAVLEGVTWLSTADFIAYKLCGVMATDFTLAGRTYAFNIDMRTWRRDLMLKFGLGDDIFPNPAPSGLSVGEVSAHSHKPLSALAGSMVAVAGHDHICAAFAAGAYAGGVGERLVFDSMGTAESLVGALPDRQLTSQDYKSGFSYGLHTWPGYRYWVGGLSASGGSLEWMRRLFGRPHLSYDHLEGMLPDTHDFSGAPLYFPYLSGSGSPHTNQSVRAAFIGLENRHGLGDLYQAVLEGTAFEMEYIRQRAESIFGKKTECIVAAGGGTRNRHWMQIKADIFGVPIVVLPQPEAACLGAALIAGLGAGLYEDINQMCCLLGELEGDLYFTQPDRHRQFQERFETYLAFQRPLRSFGNRIFE
jgi:sugar (pentulose or hexulose) kinase